MIRHVQRVMAIRDGKTASETVRKKRNHNGDDDAAAIQPLGEDHFEELVVLDSAGRLQLPKAYREALGIRQRVRMEMTTDGLLIRPLEEAEMSAHTTPGTMVYQPTEPEKNWVSRWLGRLRR